MSSSCTIDEEWAGKFGPRMETNDVVTQNTVEHVRGMLASNDASHDWNHIERVWRMSVRIATEERVERMDCVVLAALLHDIDDWKYTGSDSTDRARAFLQTQPIDAEKIEFVLKIIKGIGFKEELGGDTITMFPELACVQDADRLVHLLNLFRIKNTLILMLFSCNKDAIGAIGIARCLTFGGYKKRELYDPAIPPLTYTNKAAYMANTNGTTLNHFYEKLFKLKDLMKTAAGRRIAQARHDYMVDFVDRIHAEVAGLG